MKIQKFNEAVSDNKKYIFIVPSGARTYRGSIWDAEKEPWIPESAKLVAEFECPDGYNYMAVTQEELDEINKIKDENKRKEDVKKYNL